MSQRKEYNAYNDMPYKVNIYDNNNNYLGKRGLYSARCTATSPGSITVVTPDSEEIWYSGPIHKYKDGWKLGKQKECWT